MSKTQTLKTTTSMSKTRLAFFILIFAAIDGFILLSSKAATTTMTGASTAICSPSPCTAGTMPSSSVNVVQLGNINDGSVTTARTYSYYIPTNLLHDGTAQGKPAAVFLMDPHSCTTPDISSYLNQSQLTSVADANKFIIIGLKCSSAYTGWNHPQVDCSGSSCGTSSSPSDELYIKAAVNDATTRFHLDPQRRYIIGGSSSGNMVDDILCDKSQTPHNATLFRGAMQMGGGFNAKLNTTNGAVCPGGDQATFRLLIMGNTSGNTSDPWLTINIPTTSPTHTILGFDDSRAWWSNYLGCSTPTHTTTGSGVLSDVYAYGGCGNTVGATSAFFEAVGVKNGGHMFCQLDTSPAQPVCSNISPPRTSNNTGGWNTASFTWNFFANTTTAVSSGDSTPPTVSISAPANGATVSGTTTVSATASDNSGTVSSVQFKLDGANLGSADTSSPFSISWDTTTAGNGTHTLTAVATDPSGNTGTSPSVSVTVNNVATQPPVFVSSSINDGQILTGTVTWTITTSGSVASVEYWADGTKLDVDSSAPYSFDLDTTTLSNGSHKINAILVGTDGSRVSAGAGGILGTVTVNNPVATNPADLDGDGHVNSSDLSIMIVNFGTTFAGADINKDGVVDGADFSVLLTNYGS